jgi:phosphinothricin acetyltransferase
VIRAADKSDADNITALWNHMIRETDVTFTTEQKSPNEVEALIDDPARAVLIAELGGAFAGFALIGPFRTGPGYAKTVEHSVYLHPFAQGHGEGRALMAQLSKAAEKLGHHVMVAAISGGNTAAVEFHQKLGFDQVARMQQVGHKNGVWHDLILMQKFLETCADTSVHKG